MKKQINLAKDKIQKQAINSFKGKNTLVLCTGAGKTKIGIDISLNYKKVLIVVPTEKLRDERWKDEYDSWGHLKFYNTHIERCCYASLKNVNLNQYDLLLFDEVHNITKNNSKNLKFYKNDILGLTATPPRDEEKQEIFKTYFPISFNYDVDQGVKDGVIAPYKIKIVQYHLDNKNKNIEAGSKSKKFMTTEYSNYNYLSRVIEKVRFSGKPVPKFFYINRMRFLYNLPTKLRIAKKILSDYIKDERTLIFTGSIKHAEELCEHTFHSKTSDEAYNKLISGKINRLASVDKLKEGHDLPNMDSAILTKINSNPKDFIQSMGRVIRWRENHIGTIWILCGVNTQEEAWVEKALADLDQSNIEYINEKNL